MPLWGSQHRGMTLLSRDTGVLQTNLEYWNRLVRAVTSCPIEDVEKMQLALALDDATKAIKTLLKRQAEVAPPVHYDQLYYGEAMRG